jgi:small-conductance mechanosensitive channel
VDEARQSLVDDFRLLVGYVPHLFGALAILLVGWLLARLLESATSAILTRLGLDRVGDKFGLTEDLANVGIRMRPAQLIGRLVYAIVLVAALVQAIDTLQLASLSSALHDLLNYLPHVVLAVIVVLAGIMIGDAIARTVSAALARAGVLYAGIVGTSVRMTVIVLALLMALQQLTIDSRSVLAVLLVLLAGGALAGGLAAGWGARTLAENLVAGRYVEREFAIGEYISVEGIAGSIERFDGTSVVLRARDGARFVVPNGLLARVAVEARSPELPPGPDPSV